MPVGEERTVNPISLSDGTLLFMYYKYPLLQAFGGVLAEPKVTLHQGEIYRIRYESRDGEGRDRLEGARPIVTRDWKRSKWLNEYLVGLDELRLMASLGGRGGPESELYRILSEPAYRDRLACYASKFPDDSGSRLIVLNWVGPPAEPAAARVTPGRLSAGAPNAPPVAGESRSHAVIPGAREARVEPVVSRQAGPITVIPLAHQGRPGPPGPSTASARAGEAAGGAPRTSPQSDVGDAGTRKLKLGMDSTQPVPIQAPAAPPPGAVPESGSQSAPGGIAAPQSVDEEPAVTQRTRVEQLRAAQPTPVVPLAHQGAPDRPAPSPGSDRAVAPLPAIEDLRWSMPSVGRVNAPAPSAGGRVEPAVRHTPAGRQPAAPARKVSSLPPSWMIAGVALFGVSLLLAGWWLRGTSEQPDIDLWSHQIEAGRLTTAAAGEAEPRLDRQGPGAPIGSSHDAAEQAGSATGTVAGGASAPVEVAEDPEASNEGVPGTAARGDEASGNAVAENAATRAAPAGPATAAGSAPAPPREARGEPGQVARSSVPVAPSAQPSPPPPVAIETPPPAQGSATAGSAIPDGVQMRDAAPAPAAAGEAAVPESLRPVAPPPAPAPAEEQFPRLKITSAQMSAAQRNYLARVIRFLEPPLRYEWTPKYTRPAFFASLATDGEPPQCRIEFKEPTTISFDLVIRGGGGTESRIENVEIIYR